MRPRQPAAQRGVFAILFAVLLVVILALAGLALDIGFAYERHGDMKNYANVAALAAAHELDGTADGVDRAVDAAGDRVRANSWGREQAVEWTEAALSFGTGADGPWQDPGSVRGLAADELKLYRYARVDAGLLDAAMANVVRHFPFGAERATQLASVVSVAGPVMAQMLPLAVCAISETRTSSRPVEGLANVRELVEHGFRRGVAYNLLQLNPHGTEPENFLVNPVDFPDSGGGLDASNFSQAAVAPFVCAGAMAQPKTDRVYVRKPFPTSLIPEINSRLGRPSSCVATAALPDRNIKDFFNPPPSWHAAPAAPHATKRTTVGNRLVTMADIDPRDPADADPDSAIPFDAANPAWPAPADYGTLWAYTRPVRFSSSAANHVGVSFKQSEFDNLYPKDSTTTWGDLYPPPYMAGSGATYQAPVGAFLRFRRVLHVPLLDCPVTGNTATILAVGRFFLTSQAKELALGDSYIAAEFSGLVPGSPVSTETRLYK